MVGEYIFFCLSRIVYPCLSIMTGNPFYVQCLFDCSVIVLSRFYRLYRPLIARYSLLYLFFILISRGYYYVIMLFPWLVLTILLLKICSKYQIFNMYLSHTHAHTHTHPCNDDEIQFRVYIYIFINIHECT